jgi:hypothetical protein
MRLFFVICILAVAGPALGQDAEAEKLFRAMEKKIKSAKALSVVSKDVIGGIHASETAVTVQFAAGNKARVEAKYRSGINGQHEILLVSDGKQAFATAKRLPTNERFMPLWPLFDPKLTPTPPRLNEVIASLLTRDGITNYGQIYGLVTGGFGNFRVSGFKLGPKVKDKKRNCQWIEYCLGERGERQPLKHEHLPDHGDIQVLIDLETLLPLTRRIWMEYNAERNPYLPYQVESYSEFLIDPKLDPKIFELPK